MTIRLTKDEAGKYSLTLRINGKETTIKDITLQEAIAAIQEHDDND